MTPNQLAEFRQAVTDALAANPDIARYGGVNTVDTIIDAYTNNDWSGIVDITGVPFTPEQQQAAVAQARTALAPAFEAQESLDRSVVEDQLGQQQQGLEEFRQDDRLAFRDDKNAADQSAADQGVLFAGSRVQKLNDLRDNYEKRDARAMSRTATNIGNTARDFQYKYGDSAAKSLGDMYQLPGQSRFNAGVAGGQVTPGKSISSAYNPNQFDFQGTTPVSQSAAVQTRAAGLLKNTANKLTSTGYNNKL